MPVVGSRLLRDEIYYLTRRAPIPSRWTDYSGTFGFDPAAAASFDRPKFPRTDAQRIARMNRYVDWKRQQIAERIRLEDAETRRRVLLRLKWAAALLVLTPAAAAIVAQVWHWSMYMVLL